MLVKKIKESQEDSYIYLKAEGHPDPGAPSGGPVRHPSLATFPPRAWEDLRLRDALSDSLPGEG